MLVEHAAERPLRLHVRGGRLQRHHAVQPDHVVLRAVRAQPVALVEEAAAQVLINHQRLSSEFVTLRESQGKLLPERS